MGSSPFIRTKNPECFRIRDFSLFTRRQIQLSTGNGEASAVINYNVPAMF